MELFNVSYVAVAAICLIVAVQSWLIAARNPEYRVQALFGLAALGIVVDALSSRSMFQAASPELFDSALHVTTVGVCTTLASLAWFLDLRTGAARRWLVLAVTGAAVASVGLDLTIGITFAELPRLRNVELPWGEVIVLADGEPTRWRLVGDVTNLGFMALLLDTALRLRRRRRHRFAALIGGSLFLYGLAMLTIIPADLGYMASPPLHTFAFLIIVLVMSWETSLHLARKAELSREVAANERRWRQLLDRVQLIVVRIDPSGRISEVNPHYLQVTGFGRETHLGLHFLELIPQSDVADAERNFGRALAGEAQPEAEYALVSRDGTERTIHWRTVPLRDADGEAEGLLCVGVDVTEREKALGQRDRALVELRQSVAELQRLRDQLEEENLALKEEAGFWNGSEGIVGGSDAMIYVLGKLDHVAGSNTTVLIHGESGVGKELVARSIHARSLRADRPFVAVNCAALTPTLVESELFGHERGAFTGADRRRRGRFELANGGTLLLDEIGDLPLEVQPKLLRVLENGEFERVGGSETLRADVRVVASTNRDLRLMVGERSFREDLFYRLEVYPITVPPLRDRPDDIPALVEHFARQLSEECGRKIREIEPELLRAAQAYPWPGNVRELRNVVERAVLTTRDGCLRLAEPLTGSTAGSVNSGLVDTVHPIAGRAPDGRIPTLQDLDREHIRSVLELCGGQIAGPGGAAEILGLHPNTLRSRMKKLGLVLHDSPPTKPA